MKTYFNRFSVSKGDKINTEIDVTRANELYTFKFMDNIW